MVAQLAQKLNNIQNPKNFTIFFCCLRPVKNPIKLSHEAKMTQNT
jgi:hypothetical protein